VPVQIMRVKRKCLELLARIEQEGAYSHLVLQQVAQSQELTAEEYPVLLQIVRGTLEQTGVLEDQLDGLLPKGLRSLPTDVQLVLRLSAYQILFLERVKKRDVVFEAVELVKTGRCRSFAGLVNAVLRKLEPMAGSTTGTQVVSATRNFPTWLVERWQQQHGAEMIEHFCGAVGAVIPVYCRVNTSVVSRDELRARLASEGVMTTAAVVSPSSLQVISVPSALRITELESYKNGLFFIQDLSSTVVAEIVVSESPLRVRDLCAAPGGKACSMALSIGAHGGRVLATDKFPKRVALIQALCKRLLVNNLTAEVLDVGETGAAPEELFDAVLLDAPCSGSGTVGRKVDVRWSITEERLRELIALQLLLIKAAARFVRSQGVLVYSTCSIDQDENERIVEAFLQSRSDFERVDLRDSLPPDICTDEGYLRTWPQTHAMTGAFAAKLRKRGET
jgi:16S rRNA (cytosine967-C5)-methyltransferase